MTSDAILLWCKRCNAKFRAPAGELDNFRNITEMWDEPESFCPNCGKALIKEDIAFYNITRENESVALAKLGLPIGTKFLEFVDFKMENREKYRSYKYSHPSDWCDCSVCRAIRNTAHINEEGRKIDSPKMKAHFGVYSDFERALYKALEIADDRNTAIIRAVFSKFYFRFLEDAEKLERGETL